MPRKPIRETLTPGAEHTVNKYGVDKVEEIYEKFTELRNYGESPSGLAVEYKLQSSALDNIIEAGRQLAQIAESKRPETNVEFITRMMEDTRYGPLMQAFIIDSVAKQADNIMAVPVEKFREMFGNNPFVHPDAWRGCAETFRDELKERGL